MSRIVNLYTEIERKQSIIKPTTLMHSDIITIKNGQQIVDFVQNGDVISFADETGKTIRLATGEMIDNGTFKCVLLDNSVLSKAYSILGEQLITIGSHNTHQIILKNVNLNTKFLLEQKDKKLILHLNSLTPIYVNNILRKEPTVLSVGDVLDIYGVEIVIRNHTIEILDAVFGVKKVTLIPAEKERGLRMFGRQYKRSPRLIYLEPTDDLEIATPPGEPMQTIDSLLKVVIPPITMASVTVLSGIFMSRGPYLYIMLVTTLITLILSITSFYKQRKEYKVKVKHRTEAYSHYLKRKLSEISEHAAKQATSCHYHNPENALILKMAETGSSRMWEKSPHNQDFLAIRIGSAQVPLSFQVKLSEQDFSEKEDQLLENAKAIRNRFKSANYLPRTLSLTEGAIGLLGSPAIMREQIAMIMNQIGFFHSYLDVEVVHVYSADDRAYWSEFDFMPHVNSKVLHVRTNVFSERTRNQVLAGFFEILKVRQNEFDEKKSGENISGFAPHFVLIMSDVRQIMNHSIMEYLSKDISHLGVSVIYVDRTMKNLPEHVVTVVEYHNEKEGKVVIEAGELKQDRIELDHLTDDFPLANIPRILAGYEHVQTLRSSIPEKVGYLEMFGVERVEELNIHARWTNCEPRKTLAVPLGYRGTNDIVMLNLHEKAHGPHGLIAGTTGSGKSEIIQSYILSLATNFHPHAVGFLLIDYKGGGMANLFKDLPHLLGTITNLDGVQSVRALTAIKAELLQRQQLFLNNNVNHIDGYQKLFKEGKVAEPMPHLFIVSDEFAELKVEQPDFMKELVSTVRIGRSLGIHLILATQKPAGVVDDQIWSNSQFKLCLKVQNVSDSNEMLKTPDAAMITQPGRAYFQVGNNEIYELFQSAYSGTPYMADTEVEDVQDNRIYEINELGQYELKTQNLSKGNRGEAIIPELTVVVAEIKKTFEETRDKVVPSPWLEPLGEHLVQSMYEAMNVEQEWRKFEQNEVLEQLDMIVGLTDEPQNQAQNILKMNLLNGHIGIFGASGFGKTVMIQSMIMSIARKNTPDALHFYLLDFGQALLSLQTLPHIADLITIDEEEKLSKWTHLMIELVKTRKRMFKEIGVSDVETYRKLTGKKLHRVIIVLDNYDGAKDSELGTDFDKIFAFLTREGIGLGVHVIVSAMRSLKYQLMANIKEKITYFQIEASDVLGILGRTKMKIPEIPGRGLVKLDNVYEFQTLLPNNKETQVERIASLREEANTLRELWKGEMPKDIPVVPEVLTMKYMKTRGTMQAIIESKDYIALGLDCENVMPVTVDLSTNYLSVGASRTMMSTIVQTICETAGEHMNITFIDVPEGNLQKLAIYGTYTKDIEESNNRLSKIYTMIENHKKEYNRALSENRYLTVKMLLSKLKRELIILNDVDSYSERTQNIKRDEILSEMIQTYGEYGVSFIILSEINKFCYSSNMTFKSIALSPRIALVTAKIGDTRLNVSQRTYGEPEILDGSANFVVSGQFFKVKLVDEHE